MSAARVFTDFWIPGDIFVNCKLAPEIICSTLILHGDYDQVVPYSCGKQLSQLFPNLYGMIILRGCGHNNIFVKPYYDGINKFLEDTKNSQIGTNFQ